MSWDWGSFTGGAVSTVVGVGAIVTGYVIARHNARLAEDSARSAAKSADAAQGLIELERERNKIDIIVTAGEDSEEDITFLYARISNHGKEVYLDRVGFKLPGDSTVDFEDISEWLPSAGRSQEFLKVGLFRNQARASGLSGPIEVRGYCILGSDEQFESDPFKVDVGTSPEE